MPDADRDTVKVNDTDAVADGDAVTVCVAEKVGVGVGSRVADSVTSSETVGGSW